MGKGRDKRKRREKKLKRHEENQTKGLAPKKKDRVQHKKPDPVDALLNEAAAQPR